MKEDFPDIDSCVSLLQKSPLFENVEEVLLRDMMSHFTCVQLNRSDILESDFGMKYFHIILQGRLKITQIDPHTGKSITIFLLKDGDGFDIFPLLDGEEHVVFPVVVDDLLALRAPLSVVRVWIKEHPDFNSAFLPYVGKRLRELEESHKSNIFHDTKTRLARLILKHTQHDKPQHSKTYPVHLIHDFSHETLAELVATSRSVLSTQMKKLREDGVISSKRGLLTVKNLKKLKHHSEEYE